MGEEKLGTMLEVLNLPVNKEILEKLRYYAELVRERNVYTNLVSSRDSARIMERHIFDSLALASYLAPLDSEIVHDLGSGAGFPCIPVKIVFPGISLYSIESRKKKAGFQKEVIDILALDKVFVLGDRVEVLSMRSDTILPHADIITARAMGSHGIVLDYSLRKMVANGRLIIFRNKRSSARDNLHEALEQNTSFNYRIRKILNPAMREKIDITIVTLLDNCPEVDKNA